MTYQAFDTYAGEYDAWYETPAGRTIFAMEVDCLRPFLVKHDGPYLELGVGSGRFAQALGKFLVWKYHPSLTHPEPWIKNSFISLVPPSATIIMIIIIPALHLCIVPSSVSPLQVRSCARW